MQPLPLRLQQALGKTQTTRACKPTYLAQDYPMHGRRKQSAQRLLLCMWSYTHHGDGICLNLRLCIMNPIVNGYRSPTHGLPITDSITELYKYPSINLDPLGCFVRRIWGRSSLSSLARWATEKTWTRTLAPNNLQQPYGFGFSGLSWILFLAVLASSRLVSFSK